MRLIDADEKQIIIQALKMHHDSQFTPGVYEHSVFGKAALLLESTVDAEEVVRCKECRFAKPYERTDGKTGYYCQFCGHSFKYGTNWERLYNPIKESDDFCSYGERKEGAGNG